MSKNPVASQASKTYRRPSRLLRVMVGAHIVLVRKPNGIAKTILHLEELLKNRALTKFSCSHL